MSSSAAALFPRGPSTTIIDDYVNPSSENSIRSMPPVVESAPSGRPVHILGYTVPAEYVASVSQGVAHVTAGVSSLTTKTLGTLSAVAPERVTTAVAHAAENIQVLADSAQSQLSYLAPVASSVAGNVTALTGRTLLHLHDIYQSEQFQEGVARGRVAGLQLYRYLGSQARRHVLGQSASADDDRHAAVAEQWIQCSEPMCEVSSGDFGHGFRPCNLCSQTFCFGHCSYQRRLGSTLVDHDGSLARHFVADPDGTWMYVCRQCFEAGKTQTLGQTRNHTDEFKKKRSRSHRAVDSKCNRILRCLAQLSHQPVPETAVAPSWFGSPPAGVRGVPETSSPSTCCDLCQAEFKLWTKKLSCQLCGCSCCAECRAAQYAVPLAKSLVNCDGVPNRPGAAESCRQCWELLQRRKRHVLFLRAIDDDHTAFLAKQYEALSLLRQSIERAVDAYLRLTQHVDAALADDFELMESAPGDDDVASRALVLFGQSPPKSPPRQSVTISFSDDMRREARLQLDAILPMVAEYESLLRKFLSTPIPQHYSEQRRRRETTVMRRIEKSFYSSSAKAVLSESSSHEK
eukprot:TRINITY_DN11568_c0_g1_i1.p1 TRINITY_DN11568_c0_g1~~TRINITY_DN11568_c0_g1_i1.p1  ORF type:complete len:573 (+),score=140.84 TRINITY_DN11568_c0_g1_i1:119-1837(+)